MAADWLLLEAFPEPASARLRFYGWSRPAFTFGYSQREAEARAASGPATDLIRRPTGGGLVDHRADWTYALVLPASHPLAQVRACESYKKVHEALAEALINAGMPCQLQADCNKSSAAPQFSACFEKAETFDIVRPDNGQKIAGAAQKRTRAGMLLQGSVARAAAAEIRDGDEFGENFAQLVAKALGGSLQKWREAACSPVQLQETTARFASAAWNGKR